MKNVEQYIDLLYVLPDGNAPLNKILQYVSITSPLVNISPFTPDKREYKFKQKGGSSQTISFVNLQSKQITDYFYKFLFDNLSPNM